MSHANVGVLVATAALLASFPGCIPHPGDDFDDYGKRSAPYGASTVQDGGAGSGTPADPGEAVFYGACLSQLAFGATEKVFNFYTKVSFTRDGDNGRLNATLQALKLNESPKGPPLKIERAALVGAEQSSKPATEPNVIGTKATVTFGDVGTRPGLVIIPGEANPITGRPVEVENAKVTGIYSKEKFCGFLSGKVVVPVSLELDPPRNVCQFRRVTEGDPTPVITNASDFKPETCL